MTEALYIPQVSVVIPIYKNRDTIEPLYHQLKEIFAERKLSVQILFINDASPDTSCVFLEKLTRTDPCVTLFSFKKNVGQHRAVLKGLELSRGAIVISMDGDLQDPPFLIPQLLAKLGEGYDVVFAGRHGRYESLIRLLTSKAFKGLMHKICNIPKDAGMFFALQRAQLENMQKIHMTAPFIPAMIGLAGLRTCSIPFIRPKRVNGGSAYTSTKRLKVGLQALCHAVQSKYFHHSHLKAIARPKGTDNPGI